jgi:hypothetical protein
MNVVIASPTTLDDPVGDVVDFDTGENATGKDNIDIKKLVCTRDYRQVTLKLTVEGVIENKGNMLLFRLLDDDFFLEYTAGMTDEEVTELFSSILQQDMVIYSFDLATSNNAYQIIYTNSEVLILDGELNVVEGTESVSGGTLTITFNLPSSKENMTDILLTTSELMNLGETSYMDDLYGEIDDPLQSDGNNNGDSNQDDSDSGSGLTMFIALIAIIVIIGVVVAVIIIRR